MNVVFRVDSSSQIGSGHLMRCLTLAQRFRKEREADVLFVMRDLDGNLINIVEEKKFGVAVLPKLEKNLDLTGYAEWLTVTQEYDAKETVKVVADINVDLLIVDSYAIDVTWESVLRPYVKKIMVIDDLANRKHDCDILLDQDYYLNMDMRYRYLVPTGCKLLLGPSYALLREEFAQARAKLSKKSGEIRNIFIFFGGSDITNETQKAIDAIEMLDRKDIVVNVVVGQNNAHKEMVKEFCNSRDNYYYYCQVKNIAELMVEADVAIGAGGTTIWERCALGLYSVVISVAENQEEVTKACDALGILTYLGDTNSVTSDNIKDCLEGLEGSLLRDLTDYCAQVGMSYGTASFEIEKCGVE